MRKVILLAAVLVGGCAEHNFVPGSPLARLNGYNRTYEQIAADDCANKYGFALGSEMHRRCVYELSMSRRQGDNAYMASMGRMAALGTVVYSASTPQYIAPAPGSDVHLYTIGGRTYTCSTVGMSTNCY